MLTFADPLDFSQLDTWILSTQSKLCLILKLKSPPQGQGQLLCFKQQHLFEPVVTLHNHLQNSTSSGRSHSSFLEYADALSLELTDPAVWRDSALRAISSPLYLSQVINTSALTESTQHVCWHRLTESGNSMKNPLKENSKIPAINDASGKANKHVGDLKSNIKISSLSSDPNLN